MCRAVLQSLDFLQEHGPARRSFSQISRHTQFLFARPRGVAFCLHNKIPLTYNNLQPACFQVLCVCARASNSYLSKSHTNNFLEPDIVVMLRRQTHTFPFLSFCGSNQQIMRLRDEIRFFARLHAVLSWQREHIQSFESKREWTIIFIK